MMMRAQSTEPRPESASCRVLGYVLRTSYGYGYRGQCEYEYYHMHACPVGAQGAKGFYYHGFPAQQ